MSTGSERSDTFACFGSSCSVFVTGDSEVHSAAEAVADARATLLDWHARFTRFDAASDLSRLNTDPRTTVRAGPVMRRFVRAVAEAAAASDGLVDGTLLSQIQAAGYRTDLGTPLPLPVALSIAPPRRRAAGNPASRWREVQVDDDAGTITRPVGLLFDTGGLAKGLFADLLAERLAGHRSFAVDCGGDLRIGGSAGIRRELRVTSPFADGPLLHSFTRAHTGAATSGIGRRSWLSAPSVPAHHLLDPSTARPAYTGVVQVTALAETALEAEVRAKAAVLSGPEGASAWLPDGGAVVFDSGRCEVVGAGS